LNREEAQKILDSQISELRAKTYDELRRFLERGAVTVEAVGSSGAQYQLEIEAVWDQEPESDLRVFVSVDDGTVGRALSPLTDDFIISANGTFVGE